MMASFSEGLLLSEKVGLDPSILVQVFPKIIVLLVYSQCFFFSEMKFILNTSIHEIPSKKTIDNERSRDVNEAE